MVKPVPDVESFVYDYERNVLVRDGVHEVLNPEDATALAIALEIKKASPETVIETVTTAPRGVVPHLEDLVRRGVDRATLISDPWFVGSDTYVTSRILARAVEDIPHDVVFSGTHTTDGGTSHVPPQLAEASSIAQMSNILDIDIATLTKECATVDVDGEDAVLRFEIDLPAVLSFQYAPRRKLPYISYEDLNRDVGDRIRIVTNDDLGFDRAEVGLEGSLTQVARVEVKRLERKDTLFVRNDDAGIEAVYRFLMHKGFLPS
ncbi:MAG: hypothetical protein MI724_04500 [Spirochaetales bacterium]|nr:hypothetical protein [Spirochaetales bacterium]